MKTKSTVACDEHVPITFQFPSNGKAHENIGTIDIIEGAAVWSFNSLQTGKRMKTAYSAIAVDVDFAFQFPSNGKAHENTSVPTTHPSQPMPKFQFPSNGKAHENSISTRLTENAISVSIPFKRESA